MFKTGNKAFLRLVQRNLLFYLLTNVFFNTVVPYFSFKDTGTVYLFEGEYCFARFLLPMALLLPFIITFDILKKTSVLYASGRVGPALPEKVTRYPFMFKAAGVNGGFTLVASLMLMLVLHFNLPEGYGFNGTSLAVFLGCFAGLLSVVFTGAALLALRKAGAFDQVPAQ